MPAVKAKPLIPILKEDIKFVSEDGNNIELTQHFIFRLISDDRLLERGEKTDTEPEVDVGCRYCNSRLILREKPPGPLREGKYRFWCQECRKKFWVNYIH